MCVDLRSIQDYVRPEFRVQGAWDMSKVHYPLGFRSSVRILKRRRLSTFSTFSRRTCACCKSKQPRKSIAKSIMYCCKEYKANSTTNPIMDTRHSMHVEFNLTTMSRVPYRQMDDCGQTKNKSNVRRTPG